jgi:hypothetical protein
LASLKHGREVKLVLAGLLLAISIPSSRFIPFARFWGLDLHNHQAFHACFARNNPYLATGLQCHDDAGRDMFYPPLLYFSFAWTRLCSLATAVRIWAAAILLGTLGSLLYWARADRVAGPSGFRAARSSRLELAAFLVLLLAQYPVVFAVERGNSDVWVLVLWTLATALFASGRFALAGFVAGASAAMKLYSVFGCFVTGIGLVGQTIANRPSRRPLARFALAGVLAVALAILVFLPQTRAYLEDEFPRYASEVNPVFVYSHSLQHVFPQRLWIAYLLFAALLAVWTAAAVRFVLIDPVLVFAGGLAISTYFASTSYDYNLVVTYPLLVLLFVRAFDRERPSNLAYAMLLVGLFAVIGPRQLFAGSELAKKLHVLIQWAWLLATGVVAAPLQRAPAERAVPLSGPP